MSRAARRAITERLNTLSTACAEITGMVENGQDAFAVLAASASLRTGLDRVQDALMEDEIRAHPRLVRTIKKLLGIMR